VALLVFYDRLPKQTAAYVIYAALILAIPILFDLTRKNRLDAMLGNLSYPIYMVHPLITSMAVAILHHTNVEPADLTALAVILAVLVASMILYLVIEKPVDEIRQRRVTQGAPTTRSFAGDQMWRSLVGRDTAMIAQREVGTVVTMALGADLMQSASPQPKKP
jgi:peptidoglycan/LPS O-acetylase OafA/YrhL